MLEVEVRYRTADRGAVDSDSARSPGSAKVRLVSRAVTEEVTPTDLLSAFLDASDPLGIDVESLGADAALGEVLGLVVRLNALAPDFREVREKKLLEKLLQWLSSLMDRLRDIAREMQDIVSFSLTVGITVSVTVTWEKPD